MQDKAAAGKTPHGVTTNVATGLINPRQITLSLPNNLRTMNTDPVNGYELFFTCHPGRIR